MEQHHTQLHGNAPETPGKCFSSALPDQHRCSLLRLVPFCSPEFAPLKLPVALQEALVPVPPTGKQSQRSIPCPVTQLGMGTQSSSPGLLGYRAQALDHLRIARQDGPDETEEALNSVTHSFL